MKGEVYRLATHRNALLATPTYTHESLQQVRGVAKESSARTWLSRRRDARELFTVSHGGRTNHPRLPVRRRRRAAPRAGACPADVDRRRRAEALWTWLTASTPLLSGEVPEQLARSNPQRVLCAAQRFAAANAA